MVYRPEEKKPEVKGTGTSQVEVKLKEAQAKLKEVQAKIKESEAKLKECELHMKGDEPEEEEAESEDEPKVLANLRSRSGLPQEAESEDEPKEEEVKRRGVTILNDAAKKHIGSGMGK